MNEALIIHLVKAGIYLVTFAVVGIASSAVLWNNILNPKKPRESLIFYFLIILALTYLVGSLFIVFLGVDVWFVNIKKITN